MVFENKIFNKDKLHHAYLLVGEKEEILPLLFNFFEKELDFFTKANPDFYYKEIDTLGVEDAVDLKNFQNKKAIGGNKKILVIQTNFITSEAQNSLLKVFEEMAEETHLFLISSSAENFLDTLKSRFEIVVLDNSKNTEEDVNLKNFLAADFQARSNFLKRFWEHKKDEKADKAGAILFIKKIENFLYNKFKQNQNSEKLPIRFEELFEEINKSTSFLNDRSPSIKMILEYLALIIPKFK